MRRFPPGSRPSSLSASGGPLSERGDGSALAIEIDPGLIEAALAAVDRRQGHGAEGASPDADVQPTREPTHHGVHTVRAHDPAPPLQIDVPMPDDELGVQELVVPPELAELLADAPEPPRRPADDPLLLARLEMQAAQITRLESQTRELMSGRDALNEQVTSLRIAGSDIAAEFDRFRQRARREREDAERRGEERLLSPLLDTADNLERAWAHAGADPGALGRGLLMVLEQLRSQLKRLGIERVASSRGDRFDPEQHEALQRIATDGVPSDHIVDELAPGYRYRGRLLRPARVTVAAAPPLRSQPAPLDTEPPGFDGLEEADAP